MTIHTVEDTIHYLDYCLSHDDRVFFSRFGDGDIEIMKGNKEKKHLFNPNLQKELVESFRIDDKCFHKALAGRYQKEQHSTKIFPPSKDQSKIEEFAEIICSNEHQYFNPIVFHYLYVYDRQKLQLFLDKHIKGKRILYIGSIKSYHISNILGKHVSFEFTTSSDNAYSNIENIWTYIKEVVTTQEIDVVIPCMGVATRALQKRLYNLNLPKIKSIDLGSIIDCEAGIQSRKWIKEHLKNSMKIS